VWNVAKAKCIIDNPAGFEFVKNRKYSRQVKFLTYAMKGISGKKQKVNKYLHKNNLQDNGTE
jgi:hypothetical protein